MRLELWRSEIYEHKARMLMRHQRHAEGYEITGSVNSPKPKLQVFVSYKQVIKYVLCQQMTHPSYRKGYPDVPSTGLSADSQRLRSMQD